MLIARLLMCLGLVALTTSALSAQFYIVQDPTANRCTITEGPPVPEGVLVGDGAYGDRASAEADMGTIAACGRSVAGTQAVLPRPEPPFQGKIGRTVKDSAPDFPKSVEAPAGAPNILLILTDDVGFGATSTFGGPIETPSFQRLADAGLRYNMYHTTALCSPTRAALITGRNHHSVASGVITEFATGYPGYNSLVPKSAGSVGAVLGENGYNTSWFGKMHNVPDWMSSQAGPFDLWPNGLGFEYFYGFLGGDSDQWHPALYENTKPIEPYFAIQPTYWTATSRTKRLLGCGCNTPSHQTSLGYCTTRPGPRTHRITRPKIG